MNHARAASRAGCMLVLASLLALVGCGQRASRHEPASRLSQPQRDSILARSSIPGAAAVGHAFRAAEKEAGHAASVDSLGR